MDEQQAPDPELDALLLPGSNQEWRASRRPRLRLTTISRRFYRNPHAERHVGTPSTVVQCCPGWIKAWVGVWISSATL